MHRRICRFIHGTAPDGLPDEIVRQARRCLLDVVGTAVAARPTDLSRIVHEFASTAFGGRGAFLWQDGRPVSPPGAALANAATVDALDAHDGHSLTKGHAGAAVVPAVFATLSRGASAVSGRELLTSLAVGYEVALRAGRSLHATAADYHSSGAWNALGCAAVTARRLGLDEERTRHALGIAEYHGPRSPMMRCIDHPTMLKDGSGWGAMTGVSAGLLAAAAFTGLPAETVEPPAARHDQVAPFWSDLGQRWEFLDLYFKPYPVCRWAHPAIEGALRLRSRHAIAPESIAAVEIETFHEATRLSCRTPRTTEQAQYSLPFPVAAALCFGRLDPECLMGEALRDERVLRLARLIDVRESPALSREFPSRRRAHLRIGMRSGEEFRLRGAEPAWEQAAAAGDKRLDERLREKFQRLTRRLPAPRRERLLELLSHCADLPDVAPLVEELGAGIERPGHR